MNSINQNQVETNRLDLSGAKAVAKLREVVKEAKTGFLCTSTSDGSELHSRPMSVRVVDDAGSLWFLCAGDSHTVVDVDRDPAAIMFFQASPYSGFVRLTGKAVTSRDRAKIHELWSPLLKTWFTEGEDDPRITVLKVTPDTGYYWDNKHGDMIAGMKMVVGAAIGQTMDDSIEGTLKF